MHSHNTINQSHPPGEGGGQKTFYWECLLAWPSSWTTAGRLWGEHCLGKSGPKAMYTAMSLPGGASSWVPFPWAEKGAAATLEVPLCMYLPYPWLSLQPHTVWEPEEALTCPLSDMHMAAPRKPTKQEGMAPSPGIPSQVSRPTMISATGAQPVATTALLGGPTRTKVAPGAQCFGCHCPLGLLQEVSYRDPLNKHPCCCQTWWWASRHCWSGAWSPSYCVWPICTSLEKEKLEEGKGT